MTTVGGRDVDWEKVDIDEDILEQDSAKVFPADEEWAFFPPVMAFHR